MAGRCGNRNEWRTRVERWSDKGARQFAAEMGINAGTLQYWKYKLRSKGRRRLAARDEITHPRTGQGADLPFARRYSSVTAITFALRLSLSRLRIDTLPSVAAGHLRAWLTADRGVTCVGGEITSGADQSGNHRDANHGSHKGPQCPATLHTVAGVNVPCFSAPGTTAPLVGETLDFGLGFLSGTDYTIFGSSGAGRTACSEVATTRC
jgi:hypothetical protein